MDAAVVFPARWQGLNAVEEGGGEVGLSEGPNRLVADRLKQ